MVYICAIYAQVTSIQRGFDEQLHGVKAAMQAQEAASKEQQEKVHKLGIEESTKTFEAERLSTEIRNKERESSQGGNSLSSAQAQLREATEESKAAGDKLQAFQETYGRQTNDLRTVIKVRGRYLPQPTCAFGTNKFTYMYVCICMCRTPLLRSVS